MPANHTDPEKYVWDNADELWANLKLKSAVMPREMELGQHG
jgi:hypothetical protein